MGLFSKKNKELEEIIKSLEVNRSNNYKDATQKNFIELREHFNDLIAQGKLRGKEKDYYSEIIKEYEKSLCGYTHKDQTPYWV